MVAVNGDQAEQLLWMLHALDRAERMTDERCRLGISVVKSQRNPEINQYIARYAFSMNVISRNLFFKTRKRVLCRNLKIKHGRKFGIFCGEARRIRIDIYEKRSKIARKDTLSEEVMGPPRKYLEN